MDDVTVTSMKFRISTSHPLYDIPYTQKFVLSDTKVDKTGMSLSLIVFICYQLNSWTEDEVLLKNQT